MFVFTQALQAGLDSSHFFLRLRQVRQPVRTRLILTFWPRAKASPEPPAFPEGDEFLDFISHTAETQNKTETTSLQSKQKPRNQSNAKANGLPDVKFMELGKTRSQT
jgi:hypothetical protein